MKNPPFAYVVAGSEATGGAGLQVDLKTFQQLGVYGVGTITCIVAFDPKANWAHRFHPVDPEILRQQMEVSLAAFDSESLNTVKIGMLGTPQTIETVAEGLSKRKWKNVVLDPVLICKGQEPGAALDTDNALREKILPMATIVTPNLFETMTLSGVDSINSVQDLADAAKRIGQTGVPFVLAKGGVELPGDEAVDVLWDGSEITYFSSPKIGQHRVSGAGCTLAAALTACLALGMDVKTAVEHAKNQVTAGIKSKVSANTPFDTVWQGAYRLS